MKNNKTTQLIYTALFATIIFLGTTFFRFNLAPKTMVHIGNALVVVSFLTLKTKHSMIAAAVGFGIFDILNGYASSIHFTILESIIVILVLHLVYKKLNNKDTLKNVFIISFVAALTKIIVIFIKKTITNMIVSSIATAIPLAAFSMTNSLITATFTIIVTPLIYFQLRFLFKEVKKNF